MFVETCDKRKNFKSEVRKMRKWTKETAENYIRTAKTKGLTYLSAKDYLKHHRTMHSMI